MLKMFNDLKEGIETIMKLGQYDKKNRKIF